MCFKTKEHFNRNQRKIRLNQFEQPDINYYSNFDLNGIFDCLKIYLCVYTCTYILGSSALLILSDTRQHSD